MDDLTEDQRWLVRILREREEAMKKAASAESDREHIRRLTRQIDGLRKEIDVLNAALKDRGEQIAKLKKELRELKGS